MTDQRRALLDLGLALLVLVPFGVVAWTTTGPAEALGLPAVAVWFFCRRWVEVRVDVTVRWKDRNVEQTQEDLGTDFGDA